jgi:hypothetical protein
MFLVFAWLTDPKLPVTTDRLDALDASRYNRCAAIRNAGGKGIWKIEDVIAGIDGKEYCIAAKTSRAVLHLTHAISHIQIRTGVYVSDRSASRHISRILSCPHLVSTRGKRNLRSSTCCRYCRDRKNYESTCNLLHLPAPSANMISLSQFTSIR